MSGLTNISAVRQPTVELNGDTVGRRSSYGTIISVTAITGNALITGSLLGGGQGGGETANIYRLAGGQYFAHGEYGAAANSTAFTVHIASSEPVTLGAGGIRGGNYETANEPNDAIGSNGLPGSVSSFAGYTASGGSGKGRGGKATYLGAPDSYSLTNYEQTGPGNGGNTRTNGGNGRLELVWVED